MRFGFYALLQVLTTAFLLAMMHHMFSHHLQEPGTPLTVTDLDWRSSGVMLGFGLSIPVFFATTSAWVLWFAIPLVVAQLSRRRHRKDHLS
jgi:hypothetical protein